MSRSGRPDRAEDINQLASRCQLLYDCALHAVETRRTNRKGWKRIDRYIQREVAFQSCRYGTPGPVLRNLYHIYGRAGRPSAGCDIHVCGMEDRQVPMRPHIPSRSAERGVFLLVGNHDSQYPCLFLYFSICLSKY